MATRELRIGYLIVLLLVLTGAMSAGAAWVPVGDTVPQTSCLRVVDRNERATVLEFRLAGFDLTEVEVGGRGCTEVVIPNLVQRRVAGHPELPVVTRSLIAPDRGRLELRILQHTVREIPVAPVKPSTGHLLRNVDPAAVEPVFTAMYAEGGTWPEQVAGLSRPFIVRDHRGVTVTVDPVRYDATRGLLLVTVDLVLEVTATNAAGLNELQSNRLPGAGDAFATVYRELFGAEVATAAQQDLAAAKYERLPTRGRMLVVCHDAFLSAMTSFVNWKRQTGIEVEVLPASTTGGTAAGVQQALAERYAGAGGLTWVILVGDREHIPTLVGTVDGSDSDSRYAMLAGDDLYPDVFISRISAGDPTEVRTQVAKFIAYERDPVTGSDAGLYGRAVGVASDEGTPTDFDRMEILRDALLDYHFTDVTRVYQSLGGATAGIATAVESGCSLVNYLGHGSGTGWTSVPFDVADVAALGNAGAWPWIIDVSCSNGDFGLNECFAEAWMRAGVPEHPTGAVAMLSATSPAPWVPPTVMQKEIVDLLTTDAENTLGALCYSGLMKVLDVYAGLSVGVQVVEQNVLFGDCSLMVRSEAPLPLAVNHPAAIVENAGTLTVSCDLVGATVAVTDVRGLLGVGVVDQNGDCTLSVTEPLAALSVVELTVTGYNRIPFVAKLPVSAAATSTPLDMQPANVRLLGNYPNPFNPSTCIAWELDRTVGVRLTVHDLQGRLLQVLLHRDLDAGRHEAVWNGRQARGGTVASGVYLYRLQTDTGEILTGRMTLAK